MQETVKINNSTEFKHLKKILNFRDETRILIVDGPMQCGKTSLVSPSISKIFKIPVINIDKHLIKNDTYLHNINYCDLKENINKKLENNNNIILEGILIKKYIDYINIGEVYWIYVKVMNNGRWVNCNDCDVDKIVEYNMDTSLLESNPLYSQILSYHKEYYPHTNADLIIELDQDFQLSLNKNI